MKTRQEHLRPDRRQASQTTYLRHLTGNRRFWPVRVKTVDIERFSRDVHQLWAEAVATPPYFF